MNQLDVILVKLGNDGMWGETLRMIQESSMSCANILIRDNTHDNIGLVAARIELIEKSKAPHFVLMDYDFASIQVNVPAMVDICEFMVQPGDGSKGVVQATHFPCNFMVINRQAYEGCGGLESRFHTAYADWDLINKMGPPLQHNPSTVCHIGSPNTMAKRRRWKADRRIYDSIWTGPPVASRR